MTAAIDQRLDLPKVSVVIPTYNRAHIVGEAIRSILNQNYPNLELLVVDDGSRDDTLAALAEFGSQVRYLRKPNGGPASARNLGVREATGEYIAFLDSDDLALPGRLHTLAAALTKAPKAVLAYHWFRVIDGHGRARIGRRCRLSGNVYRELLSESMKGPIYPSASMVRRETLRSIELFDESMLVADDTDFFCRLARVGEVVLIPEELSLLRRFGDNVSRGPGRKRYFAWCNRILDKAFAADPGLGLAYRMNLRAKVHLWSWLVAFAGMLPPALSFWARALWSNPIQTVGRFFGGKTRAKADVAVASISTNQRRAA